MKEMIYDVLNLILIHGFKLPGFALNMFHITVWACSESKKWELIHSEVKEIPRNINITIYFFLVFLAELL